MTEELPIDRVAEMARRRKLDMVTKYGDDPEHEHSDMRGFVAVVRNGEIVMQVFVGPGVTAARECVYWATAMTKADEVVLVTDAFFRYETTPPEMAEATDEERRAWLDAHDTDIMPGDFQRAWEAGQRDGLTECIFIQRFPAMGPVTLITYPYVREGRKLTWADKRQTTDLTGALTRHAREGYRTSRKEGAQAYAAAEAIAVMLEVPEPERMVHTDRAVARVLSEKDAVLCVVVTADGSAFVDGYEEKR